MKNYSVSEFAQAVGVTSATVNNWIRDGVVIPSKTPTGQNYFTSGQVVTALLTMRFKVRDIHACSNLYIVTGADIKECTRLMEICNAEQRKAHPDSMFIPDFETFFKKSVDRVKFDSENEQVMDTLRVHLVREFGRRLEAYVQEKILSILAIDKAFEDSFTWGELKALAVNDTDRLTPELIARYDRVFNELSENPKSSNMNSDGSMRKYHLIPYKVLANQLDIKVTGLSHKLGFTNPEMVKAACSKLVNAGKMNDAEVLGVLCNSKFPVNLSAPEVQSHIRKLTIKMEKEFAKCLMDTISKNGYYHIFMLEGTEESLDKLYNYLDMRAFKNVVLVGADMSALPADIQRKIKSGTATNQFQFVQI